MGILTGRDEGIRLLPSSELAFIGNLTNYSKGLYDLLINVYIDINRITFSFYRHVNKINTTNRFLYIRIRTI